MPLRILTLLTLALAAAVLAACGDDTDAAGGGGTTELTIYSGRNQDLVAPVIERFKRESGIDVRVRYTDSADAAATILEEGEASPADVFLSQDAGALGAVQAQDLLAPLPRPLLDAVDGRFRSPEGRWVGVTARARTIAYDKRELEASELPDSVLGLTDRRWRGRVGWAPTNPSFESFVTGLRRLRGDAAAKRWLEGMVANGTKTYANNIAVRDAIANGEVDAGLINHYYVAEAIAEEGADYPVGLFFPPGGDPGSLINVSGAAILAGAENRPAAERFVRFLLGREAQRYFADETKEYPLAAGVRPDPALSPLSEIDAPAIDLADLADLQGSVRLIQEAGAL
jgi:iron(III) transport system substrate-binding protein